MIKRTSMHSLYILLDFERKIYFDFYFYNATRTRSINYTHTFSRINYIRNSKFNSKFTNEPCVSSQENGM